MKNDNQSKAKDVGGIMCKKLRELDGLTPEQILTAYSDGSIPVDIEQILKKMGINYQAMDFTNVENSVPDVIEQRGRILGAVTIIDDDVNIFYSSSYESEHRKNFTLAHELAHCCLNAASLNNTGHVEFRFDADSDDAIERAANTFAGKLLIPKNELTSIYNEMIAPLLDVLAKEFNVSQSVMQARLQSLELPFYTFNDVVEIAGE